jgi:hypothetical protein
MWSPRRSHTVAVFNNKLWVIGGADGTNLKEVWSSPDGINWTPEQLNAAFPGRGAHSTVVFNNRLWIFGGYNGAGMADVWSSTDGITWVPSPAPTWPARYHHQSAVFDGKMWVFGGLGGGNDAWWSTDGNSWTQAIPAAASPMWPTRYGHMVEVFDDRLWVMGGSWGSTSYNDVWSTTDVSNWVQESAGAPWVGRRYGTSAVYDNRLWVMTGYNGTANVADVWSYEGPPRVTSTPAPTATVGVQYTYPITVSGYPTPLIVVTGLPTWLTRTGDTLSGMPAVGDIGLTGMISVTASNTSGSDVQTFQIDVQGVPPQITSGATTTATVGVPYTYTVIANGIPTPNLSVGALPGWLGFTPATGELAGTPAVSDIGLTAQITITATNGWAPDAVQSFQIDVQGVAPQITSTPPASVTVGDLYSYTVTASGDPGPTFMVAGNPPWLTLAGSVLSGTPAGTDVGTTAQITITATNGWSPDATQTFTIDVIGTAPSFTSTPVTQATPKSLYSYVASATATPAPALSVTSTLPAWLTFNTTTGELTGTPANADAKSDVAVTLMASNGVAPDATQTFTIKVGRSPDAKQSESDGCAAGQTRTQTLLLALSGLLLLALWGVKSKDSIRPRDVP